MRLFVKGIHGGFLGVTRVWCEREREREREREGGGDERERRERGLRVRERGMREKREPLMVLGMFRDKVVFLGPNWWVLKCFGPSGIITKFRVDLWNQP